MGSRALWVEEGRELSGFRRGLLCTQICPDMFVLCHNGQLAELDESLPDVVQLDDGLVLFPFPANARVLDGLVEVGWFCVCGKEQCMVVAAPGVSCIMEYRRAWRGTDDMALVLFVCILVEVEVFEGLPRSLVGLHVRLWWQAWLWWRLQDGGWDEFDRCGLVGGWSGACHWNEVVWSLQSWVLCGW